MTMDLLETIRTRRTVRQFTSDDVEDHLVQEILAAGMMAPSAGNEQPWHFLVIRNAETLKAISRARPFASMVQQAPLAILVCGDLKADKYEGYWAQDCAAAVQNMLLTAHALGLGSAWVGLHPRPQRVADLRALIPLPENIVPFALLPIGHPGDERQAEHHVDPTRVHYEVW
jgi:nitroreductase